MNFVLPGFMVVLELCSICGVFLWFCFGVYGGLCCGCDGALDVVCLWCGCGS
jgi:hypothetical protein